MVDLASRFLAMVVDFASGFPAMVVDFASGFLPRSHESPRVPAGLRKPRSPNPLLLAKRAAKYLLSKDSVSKALCLLKRGDVERGRRLLILRGLIDTVLDRDSLLFQLGVFTPELC